MNYPRQAYLEAWQQPRLIMNTWSQNQRLLSGFRAASERSQKFLMCSRVREKVFRKSVLDLSLLFVQPTRWQLRTKFDDRKRIRFSSDTKFPARKNELLVTLDVSRLLQTLIQYTYTSIPTPRSRALRYSVRPIASFFAW